MGHAGHDDEDAVDEFGDEIEQKATTEVLDALSLTSVKQLHGLVMSVAWSTFATVGIITARYFRHKKKWFPMHKLCMTIGSAGTISLAGVAVAFASGKQADKLTQSPHHMLGATVAFFTGVQVLAGSYAHDAHKEGRTNKKVTCSEVLHRNLGKIILVGAYTNVYVGCNMLHPKAFGHTWVFTLYHCPSRLCRTLFQIERAALHSYSPGHHSC